MVYGQDSGNVSASPATPGRRTRTAALAPRNAVQRKTREPAEIETQTRPPDREIQMPPEVVGTSGGELQMPPEQIGIATGDDYVDNGMYCDRNAGGVGCDLLYPGQRGRMLQELRDFIDTDFESLRSALKNIRMEELVKKDEGGISVFTILVLEGLEMFLSGGADRVLEFAAEQAEHAIKKGSKRLLHEALVSAPIHKVVHSAVDLAIKSAKEKGAAIAEEPPPDPGSEFEATRSATVAFLDAIDDDIPAMKTKLQHDLPAHLTSDALLYLAWCVYHPGNSNKPSNFEEVIRNKIGRFKMSGLPKVGSFAIEHGWQYESRRVFWMDKGHTRLGLWERVTAKKDGTDVFGLPVDTPWEFKGPIEREFYAEAKRLNAERWGGEILDAPDIGEPHEKTKGYL
jgi:hypothetical protein